MSDKNKYYSLTLHYNDNDTEEGTFGWSGWAADMNEAELFAIQTAREDDSITMEDIKSSNRDMGSVFEVYVGADTSAAPQAAEMIEDLIDTDLSEFDESYAHDKLREIMELLRPGWEEQRLKEHQAEAATKPGM